MNVGGKLSLIIPFCKGHPADGLREPEKVVSFAILVSEASSLAFTEKLLIALSGSKYYWAALAFLLANAVHVLVSHCILQFTLQ